MGLYTTQGIGVTRLSMHASARRLLKLIHQAAASLSHPYWSVSVNCLFAGAELSAHTDVRNWPGTKSFVFSFGEYTGGELWQETEPGRRKCLERVHGRWQEVDPSRLHGVNKVTSGTRWSIVLFSPGRLERVPSMVWTTLRQLGFPSRRRLARRLSHYVHNGDLCLRQGIDMSALPHEWLQEFGYALKDQHCALAEWVDAAAEDGPGEHAACVRSMTKQDRAAVQRGAVLVKHLAETTERRDKLGCMDNDPEDIMPLLDTEDMQRFLDEADDNSDVIAPQ
eukprot:2669332-Amphidinium_carterae.1